MILKEIHAYKNEDGSFRVEGIVEGYDTNGYDVLGRLTSPRANITVQVLHGAYSVEPIEPIKIKIGE